MPIFADSIVASKKTTQDELDRLTFSTIQKLIAEQTRFDLNQDIVFISGFRCKPLHLLLGSNRPGFIETVQPLIKYSIPRESYEKAILEYEDSDGHALNHYTPESVASSPGKHGMFAKSESTLRAETGSLETLSISRFGSGFGIAISPEQLDAILHYDSPCKMLCEGNRINPSVILEDTAAQLGDIIKAQHRAFSEDPSLKMTLSPVFMNDKQYELLLTTLRKDDGTICMLISEILGKKAFDQKVLANTTDLFKPLAVEYHNTSDPVFTVYEAKKIHACCGTMINLIFSTIDKTIASGSQPNILEIIQVLTKTTHVDITETVSRANIAIQQAIDDRLVASASV